MKVQLNPTIDKLSRKIERIVFCAKGMKMVDDNIVGSYTYARALGVKTAESSIIQDNIVRVFQLVTQKYNALKQDSSAFQTWLDQSAVYEAQLGRTVTAHQLFRAYYMAKYPATLGVWVKPSDLSNGTTLNWADRDTRVWL